MYYNMAENSYASGVPSALSFALSKVQGVSVNSFNITSTTATSVAPNSQIRFLLPTAGMLDFKTLRLTFNVKTTEQNASASGIRLPPSVHMFQRVQVTCGGVTIAQGNSFFGIQQDCKAIVENKPFDPVVEHGQVVSRFDVQGKLIAGLNSAGSETYDSGLGANSTLFSVGLGDLAHISPRVVDLTLLPQIEVIFYTAPNNVLSAVGNGALAGETISMITNNTNNAPTYVIERPTMVANMYSLQDGAYSMALASRMRDLGFLELVYPQHLAFSQNWARSSRFSLSAMSLDKLHAVWRRNAGTYAHATIGGVVQMAGYAQKDYAQGSQYNYLGVGSAGAGDARYRNRCNYFSAPTLDPSYNATHTTASDYGQTATTELTLQFKINSAQVPQFLANQTQWAEITKWANNVDKLDCQSLPEYLNNKFVISYPLNLPSNEWEKKCISGLDTRASNTFVELTATGNADSGNFDVIIFAEVSSILRVGAGKAIEVLM